MGWWPGFEETGFSLSIEDETIAGAEKPQVPQRAQDRTAVSNIPLYGGSVTASGENVRPGSVVTVLGERAVVDANGRFVIQRILPPGTHAVPVQVRTNGQTVTEVTRSVEIPDSEWFYVAIVDVTLSKKIDDELEGTIAEDDDIDADGRVAFYAKGRVSGRTLITASADTGEGELRDIFRRLDDKDPRQVLRRLDPEDTYLVYGDDSTAYDDTPSSGRVGLFLVASGHQFRLRVAANRVPGPRGRSRAGLSTQRGRHRRRRAGL